jgi:glycerol uptake facilitator-like aquaporin
MSLFRRMAAECLGTAFLLTAVVGSGIMAEKLASGNMGIALLANTVATGATLTTLIFTFGPISGGTFQPCGNACRCLAGRDQLEGCQSFARETAVLLDNMVNMAIIVLWKPLMFSFTGSGCKSD